jgi:hypothetical protein
MNDEKSAKSPYPTEIIDLPSKGLIYPEGHPLSKGCVEIKYMTAREEDILASQNLIRKGVALDKLFESIIVDDVDSNDIYVGDKNAILLATRILGYGADYSVEVVDPFTGELQKVTVDLSKVQIKEIDDKTLNRDNRYEFSLPVSKKKIVFRLLTHRDEKDISAEITSMQRLQPGREKISKDVTTRLAYAIVQVDKMTDKGEIKRWVSNEFLAGDTRAFRKHVREISPDVDLKFDFTSDLTGETEALDIPFDAGFFYPTD